MVFKLLIASFVVSLVHGVWPPYEVLGRGWDLGTADFWSYNQVFSAHLLHPKIPQRKCFSDTGCRHSTTWMHQTFQSLESWQAHYSAHLGLSARGTYNLLQMSIKSSFGHSGRGSWMEERNSLFVKVANRRKCYSMVSDCLYKPDHLGAHVKHVIKTLPTNSTDVATLELWVKEFVQRFGTHMNHASEHGAEVKLLSSMSRQCGASSSCLVESVCAGFKWLSAADSSFCQKSNQCDVTQACASQQTLQCVAGGGDPDVGISKLCVNSANASDLHSFLQGGVGTEGISVIGFKFMPISTVLHYMGFVEQARTLEKAVEYHACTGRFKWDVIEARCVCNVVCGEGGQLNPVSCTCKCHGDGEHGFLGTTCSGTYGSCQPGKGALNLKAASKCSDAGICGGWMGQGRCKITENCCTSALNGGWCCPVHTKCACRATKCKCIALDNYGEDTPVRRLRDNSTPSDEFLV